MNCGCEPEPEVARGLSWFEATYRFAPLRNALIAGLLLALGVVLELLDVPEVIAIASFVAAIPVGAWFFAKEGWEEFMEEREIGIEALMLIAAAGCIVFGLWKEAAALVFLYSLAEAIEELAFARTRSAIRDLLDLAPKQARRLVDGREQEVPAEQLAVGDVFVVRPGEALPTNGVPACCCGRWTARRSRERACARHRRRVPRARPSVSGRCCSGGGPGRRAFTVSAAAPARGSGSAAFCLWSRSSSGWRRRSWRSPTSSRRWAH